MHQTSSLTLHCRVPSSSSSRRPTGDVGRGGCDLTPCPGSPCPCRPLARASLTTTTTTHTTSSSTPLLAPSGCRDLAPGAAAASQARPTDTSPERCAATSRRKQGAQARGASDHGTTDRVVRASAHRGGGWAREGVGASAVQLKACVVCSHRPSAPNRRGASPVTSSYTPRQ